MLRGETRDAAVLVDIATACARIIEFTEYLDRISFERNTQAVSAVQYQIAVLGEAVKRLSPEFRSQHPEIPWRKIAGMRDWVIHAYDNVDLDELWNTVITDVPRLLGQIRSVAS
jgi:uncharacterized protein with HEPN domain